MVIFFLRFFVGVSSTLLICLVLIGFFFENQYEDAIGQEHLRLTRALTGLLSTRMCHVPEQQWPVEIEQLAGEYAYTIALTDMDSLPAAKQLALVSDGVVVSVESGFIKDAVRVYYPNPCGRGVIRYIPNVDFNSFYNVLIGVTLGFVLISFALAVLMLAWPIIKHINNMVSASLAIADGRFDAKADEDAPAPLDELARAINFVANQISQLIQEQEVMISAASHELNTPVMRLNFALELADRIDDPEALKAHVRSMKLDIEQLEQLVVEMLAYSKFSFYSAKVYPEPLHLLPVIEQAQEQASRYSDKFVIEMACDAGVVVLAEEKSLLKILSNLLTNAHKYAKGYARITATALADCTCITVDDDGPGIPESERQAVLQPFYRIENSRSRDTGGVGLGLAIVNKVMALHGGRLEIGSNEFGGASIQLYFPLQPVQGAARMATLAQ
ncbi:ATP-binding protein [Bowmanella denitrificans]|uniref:ATP-binding protein n=1 Tax=Bowmanella denitrificans TaxID=366582 RepID=UPI000C9C9B52|nr:ATP-binding protein [Bowmanella denitrificans]